MDGSDLSVLARSLLSNSSLRHLDLGNNGLGPAAAHCLALMLRSNASLQTLKLDRNRLAAHGAAELGSALAKQRSLRLLDLRRNLGRDEALEFKRQYQRDMRCVVWT